MIWSDRSNEKEKKMFLRSLFEPCDMTEELVVNKHSSQAKQRQIIDQTFDKSEGICDRMIGRDKVKEFGMKLIRLSLFVCVMKMFNRRIRVKV